MIFEIIGVIKETEPIFLLKQEVELQYSNLHKHKSSNFVDFHEKWLFGTFKAKFFQKLLLDFAKN